MRIAVLLTLLLLASCRTHRIAIVGDSNAEGYGPASQGFDHPHDLAGQLDTALGGDYDVWNFSLGGLGYLVWWSVVGNTPSRNIAFATAPAWQPEIEVLALGSNDLHQGQTVAAVLAEAQAQYNQIHAMGIRPLVVGTLYPVTNDTALNAAFASAFGADYVAPPAFVEADYVEPAGQAHVHLNDQGLAKLASALKAKIAP